MCQPFPCPFLCRFILGVKCLLGDIFQYFAEINLQANANLPHWDCKEVKHDLRWGDCVSILKLSDVRDCKNGTAVTIQMDRLCYGETEEY